MIDSRRDFVESWLMEMPELIGDLESHDHLAWTVRERKQRGQTPTEISPGIYKLPGDQVVIYWMGAADRVDVGVELSRKAQSLMVNLTGKNPQLRGKPPHASQLYAAILDDADVSLVMSDSQLSRHGAAIWRDLIKQGYYVTAYNIQSPGQSRTTLNNIDDLDRFLSADTNYRQWRFVLSKPGQQMAETVSFFNTRRYRELAGLDLGD